MARITRQRASSRWGLGAGRGSGGPNGIKSPAAVPPWGRRAPENPGPPVYAGSGRRCGGRVVREAWRGAWLSPSGAWRGRDGAAGVRIECRRTGASPLDAGGGASESSRPPQWSGLVGHHESRPEAAGSGALRGVPAERGAAHEVAAGGETSPTPPDSGPKIQKQRERGPKRLPVLLRCCRNVGNHQTDRRLILVDGGLPGSLKRRRIAGAWLAGGSRGLPPPSWRAATHRGRRAGSRAGAR